MSQQISFSKWSSTLLAGMLAGLITITYSVSYAALIFKGPLQARLDIGIGMALMSAVVVTFVVALRSSFPFAIAGPDSNSSAILALMSTAIVTETTSFEESLSTVMLAMVASAMTVGICLYVIGRLRMGYLVRYIPYPVLGGFLAGTGWLIMMGGLSVMTDKSLSPLNILEFLDWTILKLWLPGLFLAIVMIFVMARFKHYLTFPILILGAILLAHFIMFVSGLSAQDAVAEGWLYAPFQSEPNPLGMMELSFEHVQWSFMLDQAPDMIAIANVVMITILLNSTGIELSSRRDADLNRELKAAGLANICSSLFGGIIGYQSISRSLLNYQAGGHTRASGIVASIFCALFFCGASSLLVAIPKFVLGGLLLYLGLNLLKEWVIKGWRELSRLDYAMVMGILLVIASTGFLEGVLFGLVISVVSVILSYSKIDVVKHRVTSQSHRSSYYRPLQHEEILNEKGDSVLVLNLQGYLFFGTSHSLLEKVKKEIEANQNLKIIILDFRLITGLDSSILLNFEKMIQLSSKQNVNIFLADLDEIMLHTFRSRGLLEGQNSNGFRVFPSLDHCVQWCEDGILKDAGVTLHVKNPDIKIMLSEMFLSPVQVPGFVEYLEECSFSKGETIIKHGEYGQSMFFIASGQATIQLELSSKKTVRLLTMGAGTVFGEVAIYGKNWRSESVIADQDSILYELKDVDLELMEKEDPEMATALHRYIVCLVSDRLSLSNHKVKHLS